MPHTNMETSQYCLGDENENCQKIDKAYQPLIYYTVQLCTWKTCGMQMGWALAKWGLMQLRDAPHWKSRDKLWIHKVIKNKIIDS